MKIKELLKHLVCTQEKINKELTELNKNLKPHIDGIKINSDKISSCNITVDRLDNYIESNVYNKEQTVEAINKEITYRQDYEVWKEEGSDLVDLVEKYCKYNNKYEAIELFKKIDKECEIKRRKEK